jgi:hypothetical protein
MPELSQAASFSNTAFPTPTWCQSMGFPKNMNPQTNQ